MERGSIDPAGSSWSYVVGEGFLSFDKLALSESRVDLLSAVSDNPRGLFVAPSGAEPRRIPLE